MKRILFTCSLIILLLSTAFSQDAEVVWHREPLNAFFQDAIFTPDKKHILAEYPYHAYCIVNIETEKVEKIFETGYPSYYVISKLYSNDGKKLTIVFAKDSLINSITWETENYSQIENNKYFTDIKYEFIFPSPDGKYVAFSDSSYFVKIYEIATGKEIKLSIKDYKTGSLGFSFDDKYIAGMNSGIIIVFDLSNGNVVKEINNPEVDVTNIGFSRDNKYIFEGSYTRTIKIIDFNNPEKYKWSGKGYTGTIKYTNDPDYIISYETAINLVTGKFWDWVVLHGWIADIIYDFQIESGQKQYIIDLMPFEGIYDPDKKELIKPLTQILFNCSGCHIYPSNSDGKYFFDGEYMYETETGKFFKDPLINVHDQYYGLKRNYIKDIYYYSDEDSVLRTFDINTNKQIDSIFFDSPLFYYMYSPQMKYYVIKKRDNKYSLIRKSDKKLIAQSDTNIFTEFSINDNYLLCTREKQKDSTYYQVYKLPEMQMLWEKKKDYKNGVYELHFTDNEKYLEDNHGEYYLNYLDINTGNIIHTFKDSVNNYIFHITSGSNIIFFKNGGNIIFYNYEKGEISGKITELSHSVSSTVLSADKIHLIVTDSTGNTFCFKLREGLLTDVENRIESDNSSFVYPNPSTGIINIVYKSETEGFAKVKIYNSLGQEIETIYSGYLNPYSENTFSWNSSGMGKGLYYYVIKTDKSTSRGKIIIYK